MELREGALSFGFSKVVTRKLIKGNGVLREDTSKDDLEDVDYITDIVGSKIQGTLRKPKKDEMVIPLVSQTDGWVVGSSTNDSGPVIAFGNVGVGSSEKSTLDDYDRVPVADFGLAMLRGMGWKADEGIGLKNKRVVEMKEPEVRPRGLGLGAERPQNNKDVHPPSKSKEPIKKLTVKIGAFAVITKGSNKGLYGQIESFDEDNSRVIMKLTIGSQITSVSKVNIDIVDAEEYKRKSKILNNEKYEEYKLKHELRNKQRQSEKIEPTTSERRRSKEKTDETFENQEIHASRSSSSNSNDLTHHRKHHKSSKNKRSENERERMDHKKRRRDYS